MVCPTHYDVTSSAAGTAAGAASVNALNLRKPRIPESAWSLLAAGEHCRHSTMHHSTTRDPIEYATASPNQRLRV